MIILRARQFMTAEDLEKASEMYGRQSKNGVIVLDDRTDLVHVSDDIEIETVNIAAGKDSVISNTTYKTGADPVHGEILEFEEYPEYEEENSEAAGSEEDPVMQQ